MPEVVSATVYSDRPLIGEIGKVLDDFATINRLERFERWRRMALDAPERSERSLPVSAIYMMTAPKAQVRIPDVHIAGRLRFRRPDLDALLDLLTVSNLNLVRKIREVSRKVF